MLKMEGWRVTVPLARDKSIGFTGEHLARRLDIEASIPRYACKLDLEFENGQKNILDLTAEDGLLTTVLRREHVACPGRVRAQVRGSKGELVVKSNPFWLEVRELVDAVDAFEPLLPGEFEQMEQRVTAAVQRAETLAANTPVSQGGAWWVWDAESGGYRDTGESSAGGPDPQGGTRQGRARWRGADLRPADRRAESRADRPGRAAGPERRYRGDWLLGAKRADFGRFVAQLLLHGTLCVERIRQHLRLCGCEVKGAIRICMYRRI